MYPKVLDLINPVWAKCSDNSLSSWTKLIGLVDGFIGKN